MHWYGGSIAEAVTLSKQRNAIFVVFVEGDNDMSVEMAGTLDNAAILKRLSNEKNFLAIKLKSGSVDYTHFAQIYQFVPVPSLFFIGHNGTPLEVVCAGVQAENLATRIDRILDEHYKLTPSVQPSTSSQSLKQQTADLLDSESKASSSSNIEGSIPNVRPSAVNAQTPAVVMPALAVSQPVLTGTTAMSAENTKLTSSVGKMSVEDNFTSSDVSEHVETRSPSEGTIVADSNVSSSTVQPGKEYNTDLVSPSTKIQKTEDSNDKTGDKYEIYCDGDVCIKRPKGDPGPSSQSSEVPQTSESGVVQPTQSSSTPSIEEKIEKAKELIEAKRREKAEKEKELERQKELERRSTGQGVTELKRWQQDQELKQLQEERKREKLENDLARQRILEQIAQDRAERRAREGQPPAPASPAPSAPPAATPGDGSGGARLQFKLPEGGSHTAQFQCDDTIATVRRHLADALKLPMETLSLWTAFPRRELTELDATLLELQLAPSAALLVLPRRTSAAPSAPVTVSAFQSFVSVFSTMFTTLVLNPTTQLLAWLRSFIPGAAPSGGGSQTGSASPLGGSRAGAPATPGGPIRRRGNIHRLPGDSPPDDDNNTWNGNSTQQM